MSKKGKTTFNPAWLDDENFKDWLRENERDKYSATCIKCNQTFSLSNMGRQALVSHTKGAKHKARATPNYQINYFFLQSSSAIAANTAAESTSATLPHGPPISSSAHVTHALEPLSVNAKSQTQMKNFLEKDEITTAEILWCLQTIVRHFSLSGAGSCIDVFKRMFPDSSVAKNMALQRSKMAYVITYGLGPFFRQTLIDDISSECPFTVSFDESLNKVSQKSQMDLNVKYWSKSKNQVACEYLGSTFLGHTTAVDLLQAFKSEVACLNLNQLIQVSMDGPNVNLKFYRLFKTEVEAETGHTLIDLGTCGLHNLHNSFKVALQATGWEISGFLGAIYQLFKNVPARRADYTRFTNSSKFPLKFCSVRWLHNSDVATRAIEIIPALKKFVKGVEDEGIEPNTNSYKKMVEALKDPLLSAKLAFLQTLALEVEPLLRMFQANKPMAPFLYTDFLSLISSVLKRFMKDDVLKAISSVKKLDVSKKDNLQSVKHIKIGHLTRAEIRKVSGVMEKDVLEFRKAGLIALQTFCQKLQTKSPLAHDGARLMTFCDPHVISSDKEVSMRRLSSYIQHLLSKGWMSGISCDKVEQEFVALCNKPGIGDILREYSRDERLDDFWVRLLLKYKCSPELTKFLRLTLVFSHGQGDIERGFSVNKECLIDNMSEKSLVAQRHVWEGVQSQGGMDKIEITKRMIHYVRNARSRYRDELEEMKNEDAIRMSRELEKRKAKERLCELNEKKRRIATEEANVEEEIRKTMSVLNKS